MALFFSSLASPTSWSTMTMIFYGASLLLCTVSATSNVPRNLAAGGGVRRKTLSDTSSSPALIDGSYSIEFRKCWSMATQAPHNLESNLQTLVNEGSVQAQTSIVQYDLCDASQAQCQGQVMDLQTFMTSVLEQPVQDRSRYCQACKDSVDYCFFGLDNGENRQRGRHLLQRNLILYSNNQGPVEYVECDECETMGCFDDSQDEENALVSDWMQGLLDCPKVQSAGWQGHDLYAGFMCHQEKGPQVALFLDPQCTLYTSAVAFEDLLENSNKFTNPDVVSSSNALVTHPFLHPVDCANVNYYTPGQQENVHIHHKNKQGEVWAMNAYCQSALSASVDMSTCGQDVTSLSHDAFDPNERTESTVPDYILTQLQAQEMNQICQVARTYQQDENEADALWNVYQEESNGITSERGSGRLYDYQGGTLSSPLTRSGESTSRFPTLEIVGAMTLVMIVAGFMYHRQRKERTESNEHSDETRALPTTKNVL